MSNNITPSQKRQLNIVISDLVNNKPLGMTEADWQREIGRLMTMASGAVPFVPIMREYKSVKPAESTEKTYIAYFYANAGDMRTVKMCLNASFDLVHFPQAKEVKGEEGLKKFRVVGVTKAAAHEVFNSNKDIFIRLTFNDEERMASGQKAQTTLPQSNAQKAAAIQQPQVEAVQETTEEQVPETVEEEVEENEENVSDLFIDEETVEALPESEEEAVETVDIEAVFADEESEEK